jgi:hypothetical protein
VGQGVGPEFKPQYYKERKKKLHNTQGWNMCGQKGIVIYCFKFKFDLPFWKTFCQCYCNLRCAFLYLAISILESYIQVICFYGKKIHIKIFNGASFVSAREFLNPRVK